MRQAMTKVGRAAVVAALLVAAPQGAQAQFGGLLRKAAEKAVDKATGAEDKVANRVSGAELTDDAVARLLKGLAVTADKIGERDAIKARYDAKSKELQELREANSGVINGYGEGLSNWQGCMGNILGKIEKANEPKMKMAAMKAMSNPATQQEVAKLMQEMNDERTKSMETGDTLRLQAVQNRYVALMNRIVGIDASADSATARRTCGSAPAKPAALTKVALLEAQGDSLSAQLRDVETVAQVAGAKAAGMDAGEYALQKEKVTVFMGAGNAAGLLTADELKRVRAKRAELEKVKKAL
jgi:hypothetical protein